MAQAPGTGTRPVGGSGRAGARVSWQSLVRSPLWRTPEGAWGAAWLSGGGAVGTNSCREERWAPSEHGSIAFDASEEGIQGKLATSHRLTHTSSGRTGVSADTGRGHRECSAASRRLSHASCPPAAGPPRNQRSPTASRWWGARPSLIQEPGPLKQHTGRTAQGLSRAAAGTTDLAGRPPDLAVPRECVVYHAQQRPRLPLLSACRSHKKRCCPKA